MSHASPSPSNHTHRPVIVNSTMHLPEKKRKEKKKKKKRKKESKKKKKRKKKKENRKNGMGCSSVG